MKRILLVDDDDSFRKMLRLTFSKLGYEVVEAKNGAEIPKFPDDGKPDLVFTDLIMPGKDGLEVIAECKRTFPGAKIVAMSGGGQIVANDYLAIARRLGAVCTLHKPFTHEALIEAINGLDRGK